jgi:hypothetical protein
MSWSEDVIDADFREYARRNGIPLAAADELETEPKPPTIGDLYGYSAPMPPAKHARGSRR